MKYKKILSAIACVVAVSCFQCFIPSIEYDNSIVANAESTVNVKITTDERNYDYGSVYVEYPIVDVVDDDDATANISYAINQAYTNVVDSELTDSELAALDYPWELTAKCEVTFNKNGLLCIHTAVNRSFDGDTDSKYDVIFMFDIYNGGKEIGQIINEDDEIYSIISTYIDDENITADKLYISDVYIKDCGDHDEFVFLYPSYYGNYDCEVSIDTEVLKKHIKSYVQELIYGDNSNLQDGENYTWYKKPFFDADSGRIATIPVNRFYELSGYNGCDKQLNLPTIPYVIRQDFQLDYFNILDYDGNIITSEYIDGDISVGYGSKILVDTTTYSYGSFTIEDGTIVQLDEEEAISIRGTSPNTFIVWNTDEGAFYEYGGGDASCIFQTTFSGGIPVLEYSNGSLGDKWALAVDNTLVTDFIYTDATAYVDGLIGFKNSDDKWGYINAQGETIIPFEYQDILLQDKAFCPSNGYVTVYNEDGFSLLDVEGNVIIPADDFSYISPVYDNKAWVGTNDHCFGVIELTTDSNDDEYSYMDLYLLKKHILNVGSTEADLSTLDLNEDGNIDIVDLVILKNILLSE